MYNLKKILIVGIMMLLVGTSFTSLVGSNIPKDQTHMVTTKNTRLSDAPSFVIIIDGTYGDNGWFVSFVTITIEAIDPDIIYIMFMIDDGEWITYCGPIVVGEDGYHVIKAFSVDSHGNQSIVQGAEFKIDQTPPVMNVWAEKIEGNTWLLIAEVTDETSGVAKVEFYQGGELLGTVTEAPYDWEWEYSNAGHIHIIAYDYAGNIIICVIRSVADFTNAKATVDTLVSDNSNPSDCDCDGCELEIELISGPGITIIIRNVGDSDCTNVKWSITFDGGIILLSRVTSGTILCIPPGENVTVSSGWIFGFGRTIITISVEPDEGSLVTIEHEAFIFLFFIII